MTVNKKLFNISWLVLVLWMGLAGLGVNAQTTVQSVYPAGAGIRVKEVDGSPNVVGVQTLVFPNGTLTRSGRTVTVTVTAGTTINSTDGVLPYRLNSGAFADSPISRLSADTVGITTDNAITNAITDQLYLTHTTSGTASTGIGAGLLFRMEDAAGQTESAARIASVFTSAANGNEQSALTFSTRTSGGALTEALRLDGQGHLYLNSTTATSIALNINGNSNTGYVTAAINGINATGTGFRVASSAAGGRNYLMFSTANSSGAGGGTFSLFDEAASAYRWTVTSTGLFGVNATSPGAQFDVRPSSNSTIGQIIQLASGQSARALNIRDSATNFLSGFDSAGRLEYDSGLTATSATAGAQTLPANPAGFLTITIGGTQYKVPYYNN